MVPTSALLLSILQPFAAVFTAPTFAHALTLVQGTLLASGRRTVASALRAAGRGDERHFTSAHRVLNRNRWSPLRLSRILLHLLVTTLSPPTPRWCCSSTAPLNGAGGARFA